MTSNIEQRDLAEDDALRLAERFSHGVTTGNLGEIAAILHDDFTMWHNFSGHSYDRQATLAYLPPFFEQVKGLRYRDVRRTRTEHGYVQQHVADSLLPSGDRSPGIDACLVARVKDGRIIQLDEYIDSGQIPGSPG